MLRYGGVQSPPYLSFLVVNRKEWPHSERTVVVHLRSIARLIDVTTRRQLHAIALTRRADGVNVWLLRLVLRIRLLWLVLLCRCYRTETNSDNYRENVLHFVSSRITLSMSLQLSIIRVVI